MKVKTQTGIVCIDDRSTSAHLAVISLAAREASHYDYAGLRPTSIQLGWLRKGHDWELGVVLLGYKHRKTGPGTLNVFNGHWAADCLDKLPLLWRQLIAEHTPRRPAAPQCMRCDTQKSHPRPPAGAKGVLLLFNDPSAVGSRGAAR